MEIPGTETVKCETNVLAVCGRRWQTVLSVSFSYFMLGMPPVVF